MFRVNFILLSWLIFAHRILWMAILFLLHFFLVTSYSTPFPIHLFTCRSPPSLISFRLLPWEYLTKNNYAVESILRLPSPTFFQESWRLAEPNYDFYQRKSMSITFLIKRHRQSTYTDYNLTPLPRRILAGATFVFHSQIRFSKSFGFPVFTVG